MLACDTRDSWTQFLLYAKKKCSPIAYGNWFAHIQVLEATDEELTLEIPNIFVQEYIMSNYKQDLCTYLPTNVQGEPAIKFVIAAATKKAPALHIPITPLKQGLKRKLS